MTKAHPETKDPYGDSYFDWNGKKMGYDDYFEAVFKSLRKSSTSALSIHPEVLLGYVEGGHLQFDKYEALNFPHPRHPEYYNRDLDDQNFMNIYNGVKASERIDNALVVYPYEDNSGNKHIMVLDGATRTSIIGYLRGENKDWFRRVPVQVFRGTPEEAKAEMVRRNLEARNKNLSDVEIMNVIYRWHNRYEWTKQEICERLGHDYEKYRPVIDSYLYSYENLIPEAKDRLHEGKFSRTNAFILARLPRDEQSKKLKEMMSGIKHNNQSLQKGNTKRRIIKPTRRCDMIDRYFGEIKLYAKSKGIDKNIQEALEKFEVASNNLRDTLEKEIGILNDSSPGKSSNGDSEITQSQGDISKKSLDKLNGLMPKKEAPSTASRGKKTTAKAKL